MLRLWVASVEFTEDVRDLADHPGAPVRGLPQAAQHFRYALGNLSDFDPETDALPAGELLEIDQWMLIRAEQLVRRLPRTGTRNTRSTSVYHAIYDFATVDLSAVYFESLKDRLYTTRRANSKSRRSAQTALYRLTYALVRLVAPLISFTAEEVWQHMRKPAGAPDSVHLALFPEPEELTAGLPDGAPRARHELGPPDARCATRF